MRRFFNGGEAPATLDIVPDPSGEAEVSGRAVNFPANTGVTDATPGHARMLSATAAGASARTG